MAKVTVGEYPNGRVELIGNSFVYIPNDVTSSTDVTIYYTGAVGDVSHGGTNASDYINDVISQEGFDKIVILNNYGSANSGIYGNTYLDTSYEAKADILSSIEQEYGVTLSRVNTIGSSAGDKIALYNFAELCRDGRDNGFCVITGASTINYAQTEGHGHPYGPNRAFLTDEDYEAISGKTVFIFESNNGQNYSYVKELVNHGVDVVYVKCNNGGHNQLSYIPLEDNIFELLDGNPETFINSSNYTFTRCTDADNNVWETISDEELEGILAVDSEAMANKLLEKDVISVDELLKVDDFEIKEYPVECLSKYEALKNIETGLSINFGTLSDTVLSSDMIYVTSAMSSLRTQIKNSNFLNGKTLGFRSSTGIPGCITGYINAYYDIMGQLMDSLVRQTESVMSVGQAIVDMNIAMEKKAEELEEAPGVIEEVGAPPTLISEEEEKEEEPPVKETPNTPPIVNPPKEDPVVPPVKETPNTPPIIIPPIKEEPEPVSPPVKETPEPEPTEEPVPTKEPEVTQEPTPSEEEAILPELVVGEREDGSKILIEMREGKVTEVKYTYEYGSIEEAESALESIKEKYKELEYIKEIKVNNTNIDIIFKEESYIDLDMDSILNKYF